MRLLVVIGLFLFADIQLQAQCTVTAYGGTTACPGTNLSLNASPGFTSYSWSPATGLSNPNIPNPVFTASSDITYVLTAVSGTGGGNLITNPGFALGNTGFTSDQNYSSAYAICNYYVNNVYFSVAAYAFPDHTPTADNMFMSVDGCMGSPTIIYETTVPVTPGANYDFSFWASRADVVQPDFEMHLVGNITGDVIVATHAGIPYAGVWTWDEYAAPVWNSGPNTSVTVFIKNLETGGYGNDFALDDIYFGSPGCTAIDSVHIDVFDVSVLNVTLPTFLCQGETTTLTATGGSSYLWSNGETDPSITVCPAISTTYTVTADVGFGCFDIDTTTVTIQATPVAVISPNDTLCLGESIDLGVSGGNAYLWSTGATTTSIHVTPVSDTTYTVVVTNMLNCTDTASVSLVVSPVPLPPLILMNDTTVCINAPLPQLTASDTAARWYASATAAIGSNTAPFPYTEAPGTYSYYAGISSNGCESDRSSVTIQVIGPPSFDLASELELCTGDSLSLGAVLDAGWQYLWSDSVSTNPRMVSSQGSYVLNTWNQCGTYTDSCIVQTVDCNCYFYLPNAFTPNEDEMNDVFKPVYSCTFDVFSLRIFNRWGQLIFESSDPDKAWDGKHRNLWCQPDVYVVKVQYSVLASNKYTTHELARHVTLLK